MAKMNDLKKILSEYEGEFSPNGWAQLEKRLPKQTFMQRFGKFIVGGAAGALVVAGVLVAVLWHNDEKPLTEEPLAKSEISNPMQTSETNENATFSTEQPSTMPNDRISEANKTTTTEVAETNNTDITETKAEPAIQTETSASNEKQEVATNAQDNQPKPTPKVVSEPSFSVSCDRHCTPAIAKFVAVGVEADCEVVWDFGNGKQGNGNNVTCEYRKKGTYTPSASVYRNGKLQKKVTLDAIRFLKAETSDYPIIGNVVGPVSVASSVCEPTRYYKQMRQKRELAHEYMQFVTDEISERTFAQCLGEIEVQNVIRLL